MKKKNVKQNKTWIQILLEHKISSNNADQNKNQIKILKVCIRLNFFLATYNNDNVFWFANALTGRLVGNTTKITINEAKIRLWKNNTPFELELKLCEFAGKCT